MGIDAGFESVELMLELRERLFQVGQFFGAGDLVPYNVPKTIPSKPKGMCIRWCTQRTRARRRGEAALRAA
jgi:hypothetical protein